ncbi:diguanylate cyclase [Duganella sp. FT3S]|uniref:Diguanylate cyclase n=1 Tax=Rugamonas fusca TaxID=2758568 RepID=A0A7W2EIE0_9BURK|nr:MASE3 domain-containing protein [Rugamonas fusca]MBA5606325.1 diguanylate cyclase [Rugamonas fusca]
MMIALNRLRVAALPHWRCLVSGTALALLMLALNSLPAEFLRGENVPMMAEVHLILELVAITVSVLVVIMAWQSLDGRQSHLSNLLIFGFTAVAGIDLVHALSYEGMPTLIGQNSTTQAIFFWLSGRMVELGTIFLVLLGVTLPGSALLWQVLGLVAICVLTIVGSTYLHLLPALFVPGTGVTPLKAELEYALCLGNLVAALVLFSKRGTQEGHAFRQLAIASFITAIGELAFVDYKQTSDLINIVGHFYKILAYSFIFRGMFLSRLRKPYQDLALAQRELLQRDAELQALVNNVPGGIAKLNLSLELQYVNPVLERGLGVQASELIGRHASECVPYEVYSAFKPYLTRALHGETVTFTYRQLLQDKSSAHRLATVIPEFGDGDGGISALYLILTDTSELEAAHQKLLDSMREVGELKAALDAHAIVAFTDTRGVITRVNDKFCAISKYSREELIGKTHRLINSRHHSKGFFRDMWETISSGNVWNGEVCNRAKDGSLYWVHTTIVPFLGEDGLPTQYVAIRADITSRKLAEQEARRMAMHDALTGLPNRRLMMDRLQQLLAKVVRDGQHGGVLLLDMDRFKAINDTLGHAAGDELLCEVGRRLTQNLRAYDTVARLGGDEFVVLLHDLGSEPHQARELTELIGEKLRFALAQPYTLEGTPTHSSPSIGATIFNSADYSGDELIKRADMALYKAKQAGRNCLCLVD